MTDGQAGLREALRTEVAEWRLLQREGQRGNDADDGYAAGLGRAIFAVEEILALAQVPVEEDAAAIRAKREDYAIAYRKGKAAGRAEALGSRHRFTGTPGGPCMDVCLLSDTDPIHDAAALTTETKGDGA